MMPPIGAPPSTRQRRSFCSLVSIANSPSEDILRYLSIFHDTSARPVKTIRFGVAGLGRAFALMAPTLAADKRIEVVAHSHSFNAHIALARQLIAAGKYGRLRMTTALNFTDFLYRPRRPEELDTTRGGGAVYNQTAHHIDTVRLLGGGRLRSV